MKKAILAISFIIAIFVSSVGAEETYVDDFGRRNFPKHEIQKVAIVYSYSLKFFKGSDFIPAMTDALDGVTYPEDKNYIRSYYLKADGENADRNKLRHVAAEVWNRILEWNPDKIVFWHRPAFEYIVLPYAQKDNRPQAYFCLYPTDELLQIFERKSNYFMTFIDPSFDKFTEYLSDNGVDFDNYYIIRDFSEFSLRVVEDIKEALGPKKNIEQIIVKDIHQLKKVLLELKLKPFGVIIPLVEKLQALDTHQIFYKGNINHLITHSNFHHLELMYLDESIYDMGAIHFTVLHSATGKNENDLHKFMFHFNSGKRVEYLEKFILVDLNRIKELGYDVLLKDLSKVKEVK